MTVTYDIDEDFAEEARTLPAIWRRRAAMNPSGPFLWYAGKPVRTVAAFDAEIARTCARLRRRGITKGDRVCVLMHNSPEMLAVMLGLWQAGAVVVPLSAQLVGPILRDQIERARAALLIGDDDLVAPLANVTPPVIGASRLAQDGDNGAAIEPEDVAFHDPALILYTSGSTGPSKGCILSHHFCAYYGWVFWRYMRYTADDTIYSCLPLNHVHALFASFLPAVLAGAQFSFAERFRPARYWEEIAESGATTCSAIGPIAEILLGQPVSAVESKLRVRLAHIAPAPRRAKEYEERFNLKIVSTLYGMSEAMLMPPDPDREPVTGIIGTDPRDFELAVVDPLGHPVGVDEPGELIARPRRPFIIFDGYLDLPDETVKAWRGLWYHTGDVVRRDAEGVYWFMGRARDVIRRGGHNVSTWEMESIVNGHPEIAEAGAVAIPTESGEEEVALFVRRVDDGKITTEIVLSYCEQVLPRFMWPDHIIMQDAELPKNQAGKIDKPKLHATFSSARPR